MNVTGDVLSASALALAAVSVFSGVWEPLISRANGTKVASRQLDRTGDIKFVRSTLFSKAIPLGVAILAITLATTPPAFQVVGELIRYSLQGHGLSQMWEDYDAVKCLFLVVWILLCGLLVRSVASVIRLSKKLAVLRK
ncbi:hypothetical protein [Brevibacterium casei]|uniref:hypothetical protein n=1 Tax=Brevibacterium casei TaxID=33889 RepID=UPI001038DA92